jgi:type I restriction enzyme S subunit
MADVREPTYVNQHIALARPRPGVNARYLAWYLTSESVQRHWARQQRGVTKLGLGLHDIRSIGVPLPPLAEQERIVAAIEERISRVDAAVLALQDVKQKLTRMRAAVLQDVVVRSKAMADELPIRDLLREPLRNGHSAKAHPNGTVPILTLTAVTLGDFSERNLKMTIADPIKVSDLWLQPGDLLIERSNTRELVGTSRLYRGPRSLAIFPDLVIRARVDARILPEYAELVLQAPSSRRYFQRRAQGISGSMPKIDQSTVESLAIPVPPIEAQRELVTDAARQLTLIEAGEGAVSTAQQHSSALRSSILASAFCGRLVPQDPADEPASALLERIASERAASDGLRRSKYSGRVTKVTQ